MSAHPTTFTVVRLRRKTYLAVIHSGVVGLSPEREPGGGVYVEVIDGKGAP